MLNSELRIAGWERFLFNDEWIFYSFCYINGNSLLYFAKNFNIRYSKVLSFKRRILSLKIVYEHILQQYCTHEHLDIMHFICLTDKELQIVLYIIQRINIKRVLHINEKECKKLITDIYIKLREVGLHNFVKLLICLRKRETHIVKHIKIQNIP